jgi:hypothetical protein
MTSPIAFLFGGLPNIVILSSHLMLNNLKSDTFTYLFITYSVTYLPTYLLNYLLACLLTHSLTHSLTHLLSYSLIHPLTHWLTHSMGQSSSWEANQLSASQDIPCNFWNPKVLYCVYNCLPPVPILSQINPVHALCWYSIVKWSLKLLMIMKLRLFCLIMLA